MTKLTLTKDPDGTHSDHGCEDLRRKSVKRYFEPRNHPLRTESKTNVMNVEKVFNFY